MCGTAENCVHENDIQSVEIGANGWVLGEPNDESAAGRLYNDEGLEGELFAVLFPHVAAGQQIV